MSEFVAHDIDGNREPIENRSISIPENHPLTVPKGVVIFVPVVNRAVEFHPRVVDRIPALRRKWGKHFFKNSGVMA